MSDRDAPVFQQVPASTITENELLHEVSEGKEYTLPVFEIFPLCSCMLWKYNLKLSLGNKVFLFATNSDLSVLQTSLNPVLTNISKSSCP